MRSAKRVGLLIMMVLCFAAECEKARIDGLDNGFDLTDRGETGYPGTLPAYVWSDDSIDPNLVIEATDWWNEQMGVDVLLYIDSPEDADVVVSSGLVPLDSLDLNSEGDPVGIAHVLWAPDGQCMGGTITVSSDITYNHAFALKVTEHELGHTPLALADDPGPPVTVDLCSVMASPVDERGEVTPGDFDLLYPYLPES